MLAKCLFIPDFHKRWKDSESIKGSLEVQRLIQTELIALNETLHITHNFLGGDWYDRGFHGLGPAMSEIEMDKRLSESVNGNVYLCVGNHFYLERDENPEMYIIQPNNLIKPQLDMVVPEKPIFQVVPRLRIGNVQVDFFHYSKVNKNYWSPREEGITYRIGVYHDDCVVPAYVREREGYVGATSQEHLNKVYSDIDVAFCGHMHAKTGWCSLEILNGKKVPLCIPGVIRPTKNVEHEKHKSIILPIITIEDDSTVSIANLEFPTHIDMLRFYETNKKPKSSPKPKTMSTKEFKANRSHANLLSLSTYLNGRGYDERSLQLVDSAKNGELTFGKALAILKQTKKETV